MRLSVKMVLLFSAMMLVALLVLSSFAVSISLEGSRVMTEARFRNMAVSISKAMQQEAGMMELAVEELINNSSFMSAVNQLDRDSTDQKMDLAARNAATQQLMESPIAESYFRVTFYSRKGKFVTSRADKDQDLISGSEEAAEIIGAFPWLDAADETDGIYVLAPHNDFLSPQGDMPVYGIVQHVDYHGRAIGYVEVAQVTSNIGRVMTYVDDAAIFVQTVFDSGQLLYSSVDETYAWPEEVEEGALTRLCLEEGGAEYDVYAVRVGDLPLRLIIAQNAEEIDRNENFIRASFRKRALIIAAVTLALIIFLSYNLTSSMRRLTRKVRQIPAERLLDSGADNMPALTGVVTSSADRETRELEQVINTLMLQLRKKAATEMTLREGTLQAQLNALQTQINPHFIYNTLNIISARSMESGNFDVIEICDQFAQMLRYSTDTRSRTASMAEEIDNVRNYLMLAKARYEENLEFSIDVPENLGGITVPKLTLQPLVENALNHGFDGKNVKRLLTISGKILGGYLILEIRDNGTGFSEEMLKSLRGRIREIEEGKVSIESSGGHIGLVNTCLRLYYYSKGAMRMAIRNEDGAVITLTMPCGEKS